MIYFDRPVHLDGSARRAFCQREVQLERGEKISAGNENKLGCLDFLPEKAIARGSALSGLLNEALCARRAAEFVKKPKQEEVKNLILLTIMCVNPCAREIVLRVFCVYFLL